MSCPLSSVLGLFKVFLRTWYIVAILQNPSTDKTYNSTPYIHIKGNDSIAYFIFYFKIIFWKKVAPCHKALNIAISSVWRDKYLCPFLVVGSPSVICLSLYMTGYTWDYEKLKIKLKLKKKIISHPANQKYRLCYFMIIWDLLSIVLHI